MSRRQVIKKEMIIVKKALKTHVTSMKLKERLSELTVELRQHPPKVLSNSQIKRIWNHQNKKP